jgi:TolA-binding protein
MRRLMFLLAAGVAVLPAAAIAQTNVEGRVGKLESEMRAVQRKVFPGGGGTLVQPDIQPTTSVGPAPGSPSTGAIEDLTQRVGSLEQQLASMTGQIEQNGYKTRQLQDAFDAYKRSTDARLKALEPSVAPSAMTPAMTPDAGPPTGTAMGSPTGSTPIAAARPTSKPEAPTKLSTTPDRVKLVGAVEKPASGDAPEDEYLYGYRLWQAKLYPEAEAQLKKFIAAYPKHRRSSFARNLLGRSYLDDGKPSLASMAFYDNYKTMPDGERAPDSLYYLAQALMKLNKPVDACKVYGELTDVYGSKISASMKADVEKGRTTAKCQ